MTGPSIEFPLTSDSPIWLDGLRIQRVGDGLVVGVMKGGEWYASAIIDANDMKLIHQLTREK